MEKRVEVVLATMNQINNNIAYEMNVQSPIVIANQTDVFDYKENEIEKIRMISTMTKGVGINRNIGLLLSKEKIVLLADDDMVYYDGYEEKILNAFEELPEADVVIFSFDMVKNGKRINKYLNQTKKLNITNAFKYGACAIALRKSAYEKANLHFSTLFGGGAIYGSGEDSLFIRDCLKSGLSVYTHDAVIGKNICKESTWFKGYNEKYFYDKGAWLVCAFPKFHHMIKYYFAFRFAKFSQIGLMRRIALMDAGIRGFDKLISFDEWNNSKTELI